MNVLTETLWIFYASCLKVLSNLLRDAFPDTRDLGQLTSLIHLLDRLTVSLYGSSRPSISPRLPL
jgi:hypothetical protein